MKSINLKKLILPNLPYLLFVFLFDKVGQAARLAPGADLSGKLLSIGDGFAAAFSSFAPSLYPADLLVGILGAALIRLVVYVKGKNAKKYRRGVEYGSARWGSADDIRPYIDPVDVYKRQSLLFLDLSCHFCWDGHHPILCCVSHDMD